jgi:hypothetical protein
MSERGECRYFTLDEANAIVAMIRPLLGEILEIRRDILAMRPSVWPVVEKAAGNGGSKEASELAREFQRVDELVREIIVTGAELKDLNSGLVDFLALRDEREVYLCWRYDENEIKYWHELEAGFAGRQLL